MRLDHYLFSAHFTTSRNRAKELICNGKVRVGGTVITKPAYRIDEKDAPRIEILEEVIYVSRAAMKLKHFLQKYPLPINGKKCLDIGSSTGGFVEVLLEMGAESVTGVDVGSAQLHPSLRKHPRVRSVEQTDVRDFFATEPFEVVTCDVSFMGISHILPDIDRLASHDIILLFKPQFEVGREVKRSARGVVRDQKAIDRVRRRVRDEAEALGWRTMVETESEIKGKEGNVEIFFHFQKR